VTIRVSDHPRAARSIARTRAFAGLAGFVVAAYLAHGAGLPAFDVVLRSLVAGLVLHAVAWAVAVTYWRGAVLGEIEAVRRHHQSGRTAHADGVLRQAAAASGDRA
jgi:hypothetical protein